VLSPDSALPQSNLSAAYFETGQYRKCVAAARVALQLLGDGGTPLHEKLRCRLCYAYLHLQEPKMAAEFVEALDKQGAEYSILSKCTEQTKSTYCVFRSNIELRRELLTEIPSYKPPLYVHPLSIIWIGF
jgi:hypothetical protein